MSLKRVTREEYVRYVKNITRNRECFDKVTETVNRSVIQYVILGTVMAQAIYTRHGEIDYQIAGAVEVPDGR